MTILFGATAAQPPQPEQRLPRATRANEDAWGVFWPLITMILRKIRPASVRPAHPRPALPNRPPNRKKELMPLETRSSSVVDSPSYWCWWRPPIVVLVLAAICTVLELVLIAADFGLIGSTRWRGLAYQNGAFWAGLLFDWRPNYAAQPWTMFISYAFLHGGISHLAGNMLILFLLAPSFEGRAGTVKFLAIYFISAIGGGAGFALLGSSPLPVVGASGALFGLGGALVFWEYADLRSQGKGIWPVLGIIVILALTNVVFWVLLEGALAWETHLAGFITGWAIAWLLKRLE